MSIVRFTTIFSGGVGSLDILIDNVTTLKFITDGHQDINLAVGFHRYTASGAASSGQGGNIQLGISGSVIAASPQNFGPGPFPSVTDDIDVTA